MSEFSFTEILPEELKSDLLTIEEIEKELEILPLNTNKYENIPDQLFVSKYGF